MFCQPIRSIRSVRCLIDYSCHFLRTGNSRSRIAARAFPRQSKLCFWRSTGFRANQRKIFFVLASVEFCFLMKMPRMEDTFSFDILRPPRSYHAHLSVSPASER